MVTAIRVYAWDLSRRVTKSEEAATAVEYGIMVALIAAVIVAIVAAVGRGVEQGFSTVCNEMDAEVTVPGGCT